VNEILIFQYTQSIQLPETDDYYFWEQRFLADPGTHPRYMEWRREFKPELIEPEDVGVEAESGKMYVLHDCILGVGH
jgi:hypothetical protein